MRRATPPRRSGAAALATAFAAAALAGGAPPAGAHGGALLLDERSGPYGVVLHAGELRRERAAVDYTVTLRRDGRPEEEATVRLQVREGERPWSRPYRVQRAANTYEVVLAQPAAQAWRRWDVRVEIDGAGGPATVTHRAGAGGEAADPPLPTAWLAGSLAVAAIGSAAAVAVRRRRRTAESS